MAERSLARRIAARLDQTYEYDREPVTEENLQPGRYFAGTFAGEHTAGTEFVIGASFVSWGAAPGDVILGLLVGNLLAVLSWVFVCSPIAIDTRLTLYWYLRKITGPIVTVIYNVLNAFLYCILAGAMITVSASAVRIPFGIEPQTGWFPDDWRFVIVALFVGGVVTTIAIMGFKRLAQFASVASPWLLIMFLAGGIATLPYLASQVEGVGAITSFADFWKIAGEEIWRGQTAAGETGIGFWHVAFFAWICNLAMHIGLSDMAILRYAKRVSYGFYSAFGMYLGHYLAWIGAGIMGAAAAHYLNQPLVELDAGAVAFYSLGICGAIAVVIAGWTTSNPTMYRAGLALQAVTPGWPRWAVTLAAGTVTTVIACSPFVFKHLLNFVAIYGLLLMPVGTIVFMEHWVFPRIGLTRYWSSKKGSLFNWPALVSWAVAVGVSFALWKTDTLHQFFLLIPAWIITAVLYVFLAWLAGAAKVSAEEEDAEELPNVEAAESGGGKRVQTGPGAGASKENPLVYWGLLGVAILSLALCFVLPVWVFVQGQEGFEANFEWLKSALIWLTVIYFVSGTIWSYTTGKSEA